MSVICYNLATGYHYQGLSMRSQASVSSSPVAQERLSQTRRGLAELLAQVKNWVERRERSDSRHQYVTQFKTLRAQLEHSLAEIERELSGVSASDGIRTVYARCRVLDVRLLWVRRLWTYFQSKFDQREDKDLEPVLKAADDIVWSCYAQPYQSMSIANRPAHPLPFIAPVYSPYAIPREEPPQDLRSDVDADFFAEMLKQLPIPVVGIPPQSVEEPWRLAFLAHEVGHHVQFDFEEGAMIDSFGALLKSVGKQRWGWWGKELFADLYSLMMIGHWALWALAELVWSSPASMLDDTNPRYPCALVRLVLMACVADKLGLSGSSALRGLTREELLERGPVIVQDRDVRESVREDLNQVEAVANAIAAAHKPPGGELSKLCGFNAADFKEYEGVAYLWGEALAGRASMTAEKQLRSSRMVLSGGVRAWAEMCGMSGEDDRKLRRESLRTALPASIVANGEEIVRAAAPVPQPDLTGRNQRLADLLMRSDIPGLRL